MAESIKEHAAKILKSLADLPRDRSGRADVSGDRLAGITNLLATQINDAVSLLVDSGYAEWIQTLGTAPYIFRSVSVTPLGRYEYERMKEKIIPESATAVIGRPPVPIGSPYGFHDEDWETISRQKANHKDLYVVLGYQFKSDYYDSVKLKSNIETMFRHAVDVCNNKPDAIPVNLIFKPLAAGYGEHLFNEIARDIISSDVAVFETSDMNPNVMIEMGVALTWGVRVLPIKHLDRPKPPSDISGQTWADYEMDCKKFTDPEHHEKLVSLVERALRKTMRS